MTVDNILTIAFGITMLANAAALTRHYMMTRYMYFMLDQLHRQMREHDEMIVANHEGRLNDHIQSLSEVRH